MQIFFIEIKSDFVTSKVLLEAGCGVGNLFYPLLEEIPNLFIHACDFSKRAIDFVKVRTLSKFGDHVGNG